MIQPQDKRPAVTLQLMIPARMHEQLEEYSTLHNSDKDYVVTEILRSHLEEHHATRNGHAKRRK